MQWHIDNIMIISAAGLALQHVFVTKTEVNILQKSVDLFPLSDVTRELD